MYLLERPGCIAHESLAFAFLRDLHNICEMRERFISLNSTCSSATNEWFKLADKVQHKKSTVFIKHLKLVEVLRVAFEQLGDLGT